MIDHFVTNLFNRVMQEYMISEASRHHRENARLRAIAAFVRDSNDNLAGLIRE